LRREEVARLAGVSLTWYTWLEQGRDISVSAKVLDWVAGALRMSDEERAHVFMLAGQPLPRSADGDETLNGSLLRVLDNLGVTPAYIAGPTWDILAWNDAARAVYGYDQLDPADRNVMIYIFCLPDARQLFADWPEVVRRAIARFRMAVAPFVDEDRFRVLIERLQQESPEFRELWPKKWVSAQGTARRDLNHPDLGHLALEHHVFAVTEAPNLRLVIDSPLPETDTAERIRRAVAGLAVSNYYSEH
jgi:transcriptional regulator with XRE-family HTH domain